MIANQNVSKQLIFNTTSTRIRYSILLFLFLLSSTFAIAQKKTITGVVISSEDNLPLPGVTIVLGHDKFIGTTTDFDGKYILEMPDSTKELVFSFIGMETQRVSIDGRSVIDMVLNPEVLDIEEVVISVPYAKVTKKDFSGSVGVMQSDQLSQGLADNIDKVLQGSSAGVVSSASSGQPGAKSDVRIRGIGSFQAGNEPLYIVDGVAMSSYSENDNILATINPGDIESMTVCKDAAAASLYGSRASNGVIIITTKKGAKDDTKYSFSTQHGFSQMGNSDFSVLNTDEYLMLRKEAMQNAGKSNQEIIMLLGSDSVDTYWFDEVFRTSYSSNYELSASGGSEKTNFYISGAYKNEEGIIIGTDLDRIALRLNIDHKASDKVEFGGKVSGAVLNQQTIDESGALSSPIVGAYVLPPNIPVFDSDDSYYFANTTQNVIGISNLDERDKKTYRFLGSTYGKYNFTKYLNFKTTLATDFYYSDSWMYINPQTPDGEARNGIGQKISEKGNSYTTTNILAYDKQFRNSNTIGLLGGFEVQNFNSETSVISASNFASSNARTLQAASVIDKPEIFTGGWGIVSYLANATYSISTKYQFSASARRDYCSRFSEDNRAGNFWSVSASWRLSDEEYFKNIEKLNSLKLRASYGTSGNAEIGDFSSYRLYAYGESYDSQTGTVPYQLGNDELTWEKNNNADIGLDFRIYKKVSGSLELYHRTTWDLLMNVPVSFTNGTKYYLKNHGEMVNKGIELHLMSENVKMDDFAWNTDFNISFNKNEITKLYNDEDIEGQTQIRRVGEAYYTFYMPEWAGVNPADGSALWYDANGNVTADYSQAEKKIMGKADPLFVSGLTNTFSYKNVDLSFQFFLSYGGLVYNAIDQRMVNDGSIAGINQSSKSLNRWQKQGDITDVPKVVYNNGSNSNDISSRYLEDGTYMRLKNIRLSYTFASSLIQKMHLTLFKIFVEGSNLWTWTRYGGIDPEVGVNGIDNFAYPSVRSASMGLLLKF